MHAAKKIDAEHNPLIPADHHATASTHTNLRDAPSGCTLVPITDYAQEIMGTPDANRPARVKIRKPRRTGRPLKRSDSAARSVEILCSGLCLGIVEMLAGHRTLEQFRKWFSPSCCAELQALGQTIRSQRSQTRRTATPRVLRSRAQKVDNAKGDARYRTLFTLAYHHCRIPLENLQKAPRKIYLSGSPWRLRCTQLTTFYSPRERSCRHPR